MPHRAIVYLDPNPTERRAMESTIRATWDNPVLTFESGAELKSYLETTPQENWPHVLFLDLDLAARINGDLTGYDIVRWLRETYAHIAVPVTVVVTGAPEREAIQKAREAGARYYVIRPATQESLFAIIRRDRTLSNVLTRAVVPIPAPAS